MTVFFLASKKSLKEFIGLNGELLLLVMTKGALVLVAYMQKTWASLANGGGGFIPKKMQFGVELFPIYMVVKAACLVVETEV